MICEKCGKVYPDTLQQPIRCYCGSKNETNIVVSKKATIQNIETKSLPSFNMYHKLWEELHTLQWKSYEETKEWFKHWCIRLPCGECKAHWLKLIAEFSPDEAFKNSDDYFKWTVDAHNKVNERLGKPIISLEEAKRLWKKV